MRILIEIIPLNYYSIVNDSCEIRDLTLLTSEASHWLDVPTTASTMGNFRVTAAKRNSSWQFRDLT